jgi:DNA polymerase-4
LYFKAGKAPYVTASHFARFPAKKLTFVPLYPNGKITYIRVGTNGVQMNNKKKTRPWARAIVFIDMNAFFASVEQLDFPELAGKPVAVTNGELGTCIITCSYEARRYGVKTGMRMREAKLRCPDIIKRPSRPNRYAAVSTRIMQSLQALTDTIEVFSIDECFLEVTGSQSLLGTPEEMGRRAKEIVFEASGLICSVGIAGDKITAKYAASIHKPNGLYAVHPSDSESFLAEVPIDRLCGINKGVKRFFADYGVHHCKDMKTIPISVPAKRFGNIGRRMWLMCQGQDPDCVHTIVPPPKSIGHGKVMPPNTKNKTVIKTYLMHMAEKVTSRMRCHQLQSTQFFIGLKTQDWGWLAAKYQTVAPIDDGKTLYKLALQFLHEHWHGEGIYQVQVTALSPISTGEQLDLFYEGDAQTKTQCQVLDDINNKYGEFTIAPASLLNRSTMPNVIAPAWKPTGHRKSV